MEAKLSPESDKFNLRVFRQSNAINVFPNSSRSVSWNLFPDISRSNSYSLGILLKWVANSKVSSSQLDKFKVRFWQISSFAKM